MSEHDFRDTEPMWARYAIFVDSKSNKFYECRVDLADDGSFVITRRWGARPDTGVGQIKTEVRHNNLQATATAEGYFAAKIHKGYTLTERPLTASQIDEDDEDY